jgi:hypothetical protein
MLSEKTHVASPVPVTPSTLARRRPTTAGYWLAVAVLIGGLAAGLTWGLISYRGYQDDIDRFARVPATGGQVTLTQSGERTIYYEGFAASAGAHPKIAINAPNGSPVRVQPFEGDLRYDAPDGFVGVAIGTFRAELPGIYDVITAETIDGDTRIAIGTGVPTSAIASVVGAFFVIGATFLVGLAVIIFTAVRRSRIAR